MRIRQNFHPDVCLSAWGQRVCACLAVAVFLLFPGRIVCAQSARTTEEADLPLLDSAQEHTSAAVLDFADWMDDFFNDERAISEENRTRIKLEMSLGYSRKDDFLRDWLILEIAPQITFPQEDERQPNPGLIMKLEAEFGNLAGLDIFSGILDF